jgi:hypothetical protein
MPLADQLSVLLIGFDLTFELKPTQREIVIVALEPEDGRSGPPKDATVGSTDKDDMVATPNTAEDKEAVTHKPQSVKQVYTLRVRDQPVSAVLQEFSKRLKWSIDIDEAAIKAAGKALDARVSFAVENVDEDGLLTALLKPAGLTFERDGARIKVLPAQP